MRDYTYISDIVDGIVSSLINNKSLNLEVFNLGNSYPISLNTFIETCEKVSGKPRYFKSKKIIKL